MGAARETHPADHHQSEERQTQCRDLLATINPSKRQSFVSLSSES